jgi:hypothetical protein
MHAGTLRSAAAWRVGAATACVCAAGAQHPPVREKFRRHGKNAPAKDLILSYQPCDEPAALLQRCWRLLSLPLLGIIYKRMHGAQLEWVCMYVRYVCMYAARSTGAGWQAAGRRLVSGVTPKATFYSRSAIQTCDRRGRADHPPAATARPHPAAADAAVRPFLPSRGRQLWQQDGQAGN